MLIKQSKITRRKRSEKEVEREPSFVITRRTKKREKLC